jgi:hypothetical protein
MIAAALVLKKVVRSRRGEPVTPTNEAELGVTPDLTVEQVDENLVAVATESGIANVDPVPLSQVAGEGIDLDRDIAAHEEIAELRERLPH